MKALTKIFIFFCFTTMCFCFLIHPEMVVGAPEGRLVIAQGGDLSTLDPHKIVDVFTWVAIRYPYDCLVKRVFKDGKIQHEPMLATSWETVNDTTWIFHLRKGVKFHNGEEFNAEAVKFSIDRVLNPATKARWRSNFTFIDRVDIVDPFTVKIITKTPAPLLITNLGFGMLIVPPEYFKEKGDDYIATHPIGTGPFKFVRWVKDDEVVFEANENYWAGSPKIKTVVFKPIPEDSTRVAALLGGDVDIVKKVPIHLIPMVNKSKVAKVIALPSAQGICCPIDTLKKGPLQDKRVRQAINYAVDKESIIKHILEGYTTPLGTPLSPAIFGYDPSIKPYPYDPEKAKALLKEAGYGNGFTMVYSTPSGRYEKDKEFAEAIAGQLAKVGINVKVQVYEWGQYIQKWFAGTLDDMYTITQAHTLDASPIYRRILHSGSQPLVKWSNKQFDKLLEEAERTMDPKKREDLYRQASRIVHDEAPALFLFSGVDTYGVSHRVQNWEPTPDDNVMPYVYGASVKD
jgi:peptide/nickel transport system substrate-binding protein